jgi:hypothetical protein
LSFSDIIGQVTPIAELRGTAEEILSDVLSPKHKDIQAAVVFAASAEEYLPTRAVSRIR